MIMHWITNSLEVAGTGLWQLIWNNGVLIGFIICAGVVGFFVPTIRLPAWGLAVVGAAVLFAFNYGVRIEHDRMEAQRVVRERQFGEELDDARQKALATVSALPAPGSPPAKRSWLRRKGTGTDQYDRAQKRLQAVAPNRVR